MYSDRILLTLEDQREEKKNTNKQKYTTDSLIKERNEPSTNAPSSSPVTKKMLLSL